ncbi:MAG: hypothetical protein KAI47_15500, partial [Deltaproteobacteria bacterium]|nr:hypothetical protein [Deltaproteobacteria bacterium]
MGVLPLAFLLVMTSLARSAPAASASVDVFVAEGLALVVGGNVVSARRRALLRGQDGALRQAARSLVSSVDAATLRKLSAYRRRVLRTYRVLGERRDGG